MSMKREFIWLTFMLSAWITIAASDNSMLREDRVWEYFSYEYKENYTECALERYGFDWHEEVNGKIYKRCILLDRTSWRTPDRVMGDYYNTTDVRTEKIGECVALFREEDSRIWILFDTDAESLHYSPAPYDKITTLHPSPFEEKLLFDFGAKFGEVIDCFMNSYAEDWMLTQAEVAAVEEVPVESKVRRKLTLSNVAGTNWSNNLSIFIHSEWLEGVGNIGKGGMLLFGGVQWPEPDCYCGHGGYFNNLYDLDGNVIYKGADIRIGSNGVNAVASDSETGKSDAIYDLMGHSVKRVLPGSVYIRYGKKFVGK